jgi:MFS family permease
MGNTYLTVYAHFHLGYTRSFIWAVGALGGLASIVSVVLSASLSDRVGRRRMMLLGWSGCVPWALAVMPLMDTHQPVLYAIAIVGMSAIAAIGSGPTGALIPELFATRYRYSGSALAVNTAGVFGGALPPLIAGTLQATYGSWAVGPMLAILAAASLVCTYLLPETKGTALQSTPGAGVAAVPSEA